MRARAYLLILSFGLVLGSVGCGKVEIGIDQPNAIAPVNPVTSLTNGAEFVSGSAQAARTINGYSVDTSVGSTYGKLEVKTPNGYKVYSTVQGRMLSEQPAR